MSMVRDQVFISYSHQDKRFLEELQTHLKPLERDWNLDAWDDTRIPTDAQWKAEIEKALGRARVGVLLVSAGFLESDFISRREVPELLRGARESGVEIVWVPVSDCNWDLSPVEPFQAAHPPGQPLDQIKKAKRQSVWKLVSRKIHEAYSNWQPPAANHAVGNPFNPWKPAEPPRFFGRGEELYDLEQALGAGTSISLVGDRRIGKSSLLNLWHYRVQELDPERLVIGLTCEEREGATVAEFVTKVTGRLAPDDAENAGEQLVTWARQQDKAPLLLVDEADRMVERFDPRFFERMRGALDDLHWVLASRRDLDLIHRHFHGTTSPFLNRLQLVRLGLLEKQEAEELLDLGANLLGVEDRSVALRWGGCHPFFLALFGHHAWRSRSLGIALKKGHNRAVDESFGHLRLILDKAERQKLAAALESGPLESGALRSWRNRGLVTAEDELFGEVLRAWLREEL